LYARDALVALTIIDKSFQISKEIKQATHSVGQSPAPDLRIKENGQCSAKVLLKFNRFDFSDRGLVAGEVKGTGVGDTKASAKEEAARQALEVSRTASMGLPFNLTIFLIVSGSGRDINSTLYRRLLVVIHTYCTSLFPCSPMSFVDCFWLLSQSGCK
jgi:hypothetical protein